MRMGPITFSGIEHADAEQACELLDIALGTGYGRQKSPALWNWKHTSNPAGASLGCAAYGPNGELIGLRPFMRWRLIDQTGTVINVARAVDTAVHPEWRRAGLFTKMTQASLDALHEQGIALIFNTPNDQSAPGYQKMGWNLLGHPRLWVRPRPSGLLGRRSDTQRDATHALTHFSETTAVAASSAQRPPERGGVAVLKDTAFLKWRYGRHPNLEYRVLEGGNGLAVVRSDIRAGRQGVAISDLFVNDDPDASLRGLVSELARATAGAYLVMGPLRSLRWRAAALSLGFIPVPWRNVNLAVRSIPAEDTSPLNRRRDSWQLSLGDMETF